MSEQTRGVRRLEPTDLGIGALFSLVGDAVIAGDASVGRIVLWNPAAERLFGYSADEALGMPIEALVPPPLKGRHRDGLARFAARGETNLVGTGRAVELPARHKDGRQLWVELTLTAVDSAGVPGRFVLALVRDVTERRHTQAQLAATADQLEAANRSLREFLVMAAHDLRSPLATVMAAAGLLDSRELSPDQVTELSGIITRQVEQLADLIGDLADLGQIELGETRTSPVPVPVPKVVREAQEAAGLSDQAVTVDVPDDLAVWADHGHVRRMLVNYLANARNYAATGIAVTARAAGESVEICVADTGPGVPPEFAGRLFDKFSRSATVAGQPGRGLGLAIVEGLAQRNRGAAWYEPNEPIGARFWIRLPAGKPEPEVAT